MSARERYKAGSAHGARIDKDGETWTLVLTRDLRHSPEIVWEALTDPAQLREWAPFDADGNLGTTGSRISLTTVGAPEPHITETTILRADAP
ncbi:MAG TPA: SRPBCC domain-containing protein, partial [Bryobacteraceae bacterium]|nr:SRPBCC domain-containing protein [Bryobacteraceae bacterium]